MLYWVDDIRNAEIIFVFLDQCAQLRAAKNTQITTFHIVDMYLYVLVRHTVSVDTY